MKDKASKGIGLGELESNHRDVFYALERFESATPSEGTTKAAELLSFLERYTTNHFAQEERAMAAYRYPDAAAHQEAHQNIRRMVKATRKLYETQGPSASVGEALRATVRNMLHDQVVTHDRALMTFLASHPQPLPRPSPAL